MADTKLKKRRNPSHGKARRRHRVKRQQHFLVPLSEIEVDYSLNGRTIPHSEEEIKKYAESYKLVGQLQPVTVRKVEGNRFKLVFGYGRYRAAEYYNKHIDPKDPIKLKCFVHDGNEEESFLRNLVENLHRKGLEPIETAHNQRRLRENHGWTDQQIADFYSITPAYVVTMKALLKAPEAVQKEVKDGNMSAAVLAEAANNLSTPELVQAVEAAKDRRTGKVQSAIVKQKVRAKRQQAGRVTTLSMKEVKDYFAGKTGPAEPEPVRKLCNSILDFLEGRASEQELDIDIDEFIETPALLQLEDGDTVSTHSAPRA